VTCGKQVAKGEEKLDGKLPINRTLREKERLMTLREEIWREREEEGSKDVRCRSMRPRKKVFDNLANLCKEVVLC